MKLIILYKYLFMFSCLIGFTSCGSWYYCTVSGFGTTPERKTFYISTNDSLSYEKLEYAEYSSILSQRLIESGYIKSTPEQSDLCILFDYYIGDKEMVGTLSYQNTYSFTNSNGKITTQTNRQGKATVNTKVNGNSIKTDAKANGNATQTTNKKQAVNTFTTSATSSTVEYRQGIGCIIKAIDRTTNEEIWMVEVKDFLEGSNSFRKLMPWMIASAQYYFGKSGEAEVKITKKEGVEQKGLIWPY